MNQMERNVKKTILILAGLGLLAAAPAQANEPYLPRGQKTFDRIDTNKDGKLEKSEFLPVAGRRLARMDVNGDKSVTAAEIEARLQERLKRRRDAIMAIMDADKNGTITESELDNVVAAMFNGADSDKDGGVSMAEVKGFKRGQWRKAYLLQGQPAASGGN